MSYFQYGCGDNVHTITTNIGRSAKIVGEDTYDILQNNEKSNAMTFKRTTKYHYNA